jgi:hypothetical protein
MHGKLNKRQELRNNKDSSRKKIFKKANEKIPLSLLLKRHINTIEKQKKEEINV